MVKIAETANISKLCLIQESIRGTSIIIGENVFIDAFVKIQPVGGTGDIIIGNSCNINSGTTIHSGNGVYIGDNVLIAPNCVLSGSNHQYSDKNVLIRHQGFKPSKGGILIEDDVWIGAGCIILDGAVLKKGCVVGANSLVNSIIPEYAICTGSPANVISYRE